MRVRWDSDCPRFCRQRTVNNHPRTIFFRLLCTARCAAGSPMHASNRKKSRNHSRVPDMFGMATFEHDAISHAALSALLRFRWTCVIVEPRIRFRIVLATEWSKRPDRSQRRTRAPAFSFASTLQRRNPCADQFGRSGAEKSRVPTNTLA